MMMLKYSSDHLLCAVWPTWCQSGIRHFTALHVCRSACGRIGYEDLTEFAPHSLRHGCISSHAKSGATIAQLQSLSKHKSLSSLQKYIKLGDFEHGL